MFHSESDRSEPRPQSEEEKRKFTTITPWPGQACGYKIDHSEIVRLRAKAQAAMGGRYDFRAFNDVVVKAGGVPLTVLEEIVGAHIRA